MDAWVSWLILLQLSSVFVRGYDNVGFDGWYQPVPHQPVDIITDVINDLGVRILQQYTAHGNVAFSPTGVGFVLAALYEGSAGRGRQQIADALGLPRDRDISRIGFRDIHRRLRTYLNADGLLGGLTLNQESTKLRPEYEDILRFYGFDLSIPEEEANETTHAPSALTEQPATEAREEITTPIATAPTIQSSETTTEVSTSTTPMGETLGTTTNTEDEEGKNTQTTPAATTLLDTTKAAPTDMPSSPTAPSTQMISTPSMTATTTASTVEESQSSAPTTTVTASTIQSLSIEGSATTASTLSISTSTIPPPTSTISDPPTSTPMEAGSGSSASANRTAESTAASGATEPVSKSTITDASIITTTSPVNVTEASASSTISAQVNEASTESANGPPADENTVSTDSMNNQSIPSEIGSTDLPITTIASGESGSTGQPATESTAVSGVMNRRKRSVRSPRGFFFSYPDEGIWMQELGIWKPYSIGLNEATVRDSTEISFLVNGCDVSSVTATRYFAVLPFAYFPSLHAIALEFPLDDPRYNILLMMATDRRDTHKLARDLGGKSLRLLRKQLQATWVRATIPSFMLRGFVTLTSFLQRLGIVDVFEPRTADLSPMTPDLGVYARDVQQSIGVNIRNYMKPDRTHSRNGLFERAGPVPFTVVHPFLYFIVDAETSVALISGRVNDPLNSRIL